MVTRAKRYMLLLHFLALAACGGGAGSGGSGGSSPPPPPPPSAPDLVVAISAPAATTPGTAIEYVVTVTSNGTSAASNVKTELTIPGGFMPNAISDNGGVSDGVVSWDAIDSMAAGESVEFTVGGDAPLVGPIVATAVATLDETDSTPADNSSTVRTVLTFDAIGPMLVGEAAGDFFGEVADYLGDINGDGIADFVIGARFADGGGADGGALYVYSGAAVAGGSSTPLYVHFGAAGTGLGQSVSSVGDLDGDGVPDYGGGAPQNGTGSIQLYSGATGTLIRSVAGQNGGDRYGFAMAEAGGDIDSDGVPDIVVGAPGADGGAGRVHLISGNDGSEIRSHPSPGGSEFGSGVGGFGDLNGDGRADYAGGVTNPAPGMVVVYSGVDGAELYRFSDTAAGSSLLGAFWIDTPGDIDGDGVNDVFFSDIERNAGAGRIYLLSGASGDLLFSVDGEAAGDVFGIGRNSGFDDNNDGVPDIFVAAYRNAEGGARAGKGYVVSGRDGMVLRTMAGTIPEQTLGYDAVQLGDIDGDGIGDYLLTGDIENGLAGSAVVVKGVPFQ